MRKGLAHIVVIGIIAVLLIGGLGYYAYAGSQKKSTTPTPSVAPSSTPEASVTPSKDKLVTAEELTFRVPTAWTEVITDPSVNLRQYRYADPQSSDYVQIQVFTTGSGDSAPVSIWHYKLNGKAFVPVSETSDCDPATSMCSKGGGALLLSVQVDNLTDEVSKGRIYSISMGNTKSETADRQVFRDIFKTAKFK